MAIIHILLLRKQVTESLSKFPKVTDEWNSDSHLAWLTVGVHSQLVIQVLTE